MRLFAALLVLLSSSSALAQELAVVLADRTATFDRATLLARPDLTEIVFTATAPGEYQTRLGRARGVPLAALVPLSALPAGAALSFQALDGFAMSIPVERLAVAEPFVAVEPPDAPWPPVRPAGPSGGPFFLVWGGPGQGAVPTEFWPYQLGRIEVKRSLAERFPQMLPDPAADATVRRGLAVFQETCMACHRINGAGDATKGPDLNRPMSPTEYFQPAALRQYVRDPASLRSWPDQQMPGFNAGQLPDADLDAVLAYLAHMAGRKH